MACTQATLAAPAPCLEYTSGRKQREALTLFLCQILKKLVPATTCSVSQFNTTLTNNEALVCMGAGRARAKLANIICSGLNIDCDDLECFSEDQLAALQLYFACEIIDQVNP